MIREFIADDIKEIDAIGSLIKNNFVEKNDIINIKNQDYIKLFVYDDDGIKGFVHIEQHFEIIDIINLAVKTEYQQKGIATMLLNYVIAHIEAEKILLEVRETNKKARAFYLKNGFKEINRRKKYYIVEDAIIMERNL